MCKRAGIKGVKHIGGEIKMNRKGSSRLELKRDKKGGGETIMRLLVVLLLLGLGGGIVYAASPDMVYLTVTPIFNLSINISSTSYDFGGGASVDLGDSRTICVGLIENDGTVASIWQKQASTLITANSPDSNKWTLVTNNRPGKNEFQLLVISTGDTSVVNLNTGGTWPNKSMVGIEPLQTVTGSYTDLVEGGTESPIHPRSETRKLWATLLMPTNITTTGGATITLSVQAVVR